MHTRRLVISSILVMGVGSFLPRPANAILPAVGVAVRVLAPYVIGSAVEYSVGALVKYQNKAGMTRYVRTRMPLQRAEAAFLQRRAAKGLMTAVAMGAVELMVASMSGDSLIQPACNGVIINGDIDCQTQTETTPGCPSTWWWTPSWSSGTKNCYNLTQPNTVIPDPNGRTYTYTLGSCYSSQSDGQCKAYWAGATIKWNDGRADTVIAASAHNYWVTMSGTKPPATFTTINTPATDAQLGQSFDDYFDPSQRTSQLPNLFDGDTSSVIGKTISLPDDAVRADPQLGTDLQNIGAGHPELITDPTLREERQNLWNDLNMTAEELAALLNQLEQEHPGSTTESQVQIPTDYARENTQQAGNAKLDQLHQDLSATPPAIPPVEHLSFAPGWARLKAAMLNMPSINVGSLSGQCPMPSFDFFGVRTITIRAQCDLAEAVRPTIHTLMIVVFSIVALFIVLSA